MTDKEIAQWLRSARIWAKNSLSKSANESWFHAMTSVRIVNSVINPINWED